MQELMHGYAGTLIRLDQEEQEEFAKLPDYVLKVIAGYEMRCFEFEVCALAKHTH